MTKLRVLLADDSTVVRDGVKRLLNAQPDMEVVGEAADGLTALEQTRALQPDILVLDIAMPDLSGIDVSLRLRQAYPAVKIVFLTMHEEASYQAQARQAGAAGYVLKRVAAEELTQAIRIVAAGGIYWDPAVIAPGLVRDGAAETWVALGAALSAPDEAILRRIAAGQSNQEIAGQLGLSLPAVESAKARVMDQLGLATRAAVVRYAEQQGWLPGTREPDPPPLTREPAGGSGES